MTFPSVPPRDCGKFGPASSREQAPIVPCGSDRGRADPRPSRKARRAARKGRWFIQIRKTRSGDFVTSFGPYSEEPPEADVKRARKMFPGRKIVVVNQTGG